MYGAVLHPHLVYCLLQYTKYPLGLSPFLFIIALTFLACHTHPLRLLCPPFFIFLSIEQTSTKNRLAYVSIRFVFLNGPSSHLTPFLPPVGWTTKGRNYAFVFVYVPPQLVSNSPVSLPYLHGNLPFSLFISSLFYSISSCALDPSFYFTPNNFPPSIAFPFLSFTRKHVNNMRQPQLND